MTSCRGKKATWRDVSRSASPTGSTAADPHGPAVLAGCQHAAEAAHRRAGEQKQVRDDCFGDAFRSSVAFAQEIPREDKASWSDKIHSKLMHYQQLLLLL